METVAIFNILRNVPQINEEQAHELAEAIGGKSDFATKADLARLEGNLRGEIKALAGQVKMLIGLVIGLYVGIAVLFVNLMAG